MSLDSSIVNYDLSFVAPFASRYQGGFDGLNLST